MNEGKGMHTFDGDGGGNSLGGPTKEIGGGQGEDRAQALAARQKAVLHGLVQTGRRFGRGGEKPL